MTFTAYIAIQNFNSDLPELIFDDFAIKKIKGRNYEYYKEIFTDGIFRNGGQYVIERIYSKKPELDDALNDISSFGRIPEDSEDLMFALRLFKTGDLVFIKQMIRNSQGKLLSQYKYPMVFSEYHSPTHYKMTVQDITNFNNFFKELLRAKGWNASWFKIARRYFLWGGSKEFLAGRDDERILDFIIALESLLVFENDFVSRRLRERSAAIMNEEDEDSVKKLINNFYGFRSILAHGGALNRKNVDYITKNSKNFERLIRLLFKEIIVRCPPEEKEHRAFLSTLYDIGDEERVENLKDGFGKIKSAKTREDLIKDFQGLIK